MILGDAEGIGDFSISNETFEDYLSIIQLVFLRGLFIHRRKCAVRIGKHSTDSMHNRQ